MKQAWFVVASAAWLVIACGAGEFSGAPAGESGFGGAGGAPLGAGAGGSSGGNAAAASAGSGDAAGLAGQTTNGGAAGGGAPAAAGGAVFAGSGGVTARAACEEACVADRDCAVFGADQGFRCNPATRRCEKFARPCRSAEECMPDASLWLTSCGSDADCILFADDVCVTVGASGRCARLAPGTAGASGCEFPTADAVSMPRVGTSAPVLVCANASLACVEGVCRAGCRTDAECTPDRNGSVCDTASRSCRCVKNEDCGGPGVSRCNPATGSCECESAADCTDVPNTDACAAGRCGCSSRSACNAERVFSGTLYVCE